MSNKICTFFFILTFISCDKNEKIEESEITETFVHKDIDFSFADSISGIYTGPRVTNSGPPNFTIYQQEISIGVIDARTEKECKFYIDLFNEEIFLLRDFSFTTNWNFLTFQPTYGSIYITKSEFVGDSLLLEESYFSHDVNYKSFTFHGVKQ